MLLMRTSTGALSPTEINQGIVTDEELLTLVRSIFQDYYPTNRMASAFT